MSADHTQPDLLDMLAEHAVVPDFRAGFLAGLRRAVTYLQDYGHTVPTDALVALQAPLLRALAVAECDDCTLSGCVVDEHGRSVEHHPLRDATVPS